MKVVCTCNCSHGKKGDLLELEGVKELTERQKVMLAPVEDKPVKKVAAKKEPEKKEPEK